MAHETYVPKHRAAPVSKTVSRAPRNLRLPAIPQAKRVVVASGIAAAATGVAVTTGVAGSTASTLQLASAAANNAAGAKGTAAQIVSERTPAFTRSLDRQALARKIKAAALSSTSGAAVGGSVSISPVKAAASTGDPKAITLALMPSFGFSPSDFSCIDQIWTQESGWNVHADNPSSGAYGIPQALPGSKMASAGPNWQNDATTQIKWGLGYIKASYGTPCNAAAFKLAHGWY